MSIAALIGAAAAAACSVVSPAHTVALVELYTSQGCSSCPPADQWLSRLPAQLPPERAIPLALHVGYWDYIGWKDPFAQREFNARQNWLAQLNRNRTVYTPGIFVGAREWPNWRDGSAFAREVARLNQQPAGISLRLAATPLAQQVRIEVGAEAAGGAAVPASAALFVALKQHGQVTAVARGENRGETLRNDHVVRAWVGPLPVGTSTQQITLPADGPRRFELVAFAQDRGAGTVLQSVALPLEPCGIR